MAIRAPAIKAKKSKVKRVEPKRKSSNERGYGFAWQKARFYYFKKHPLCVHCEVEGLIIPATDLDHIIPHQGNKVLFWDSSNWQGLCHSCHSRKTVLEDGGFGLERK